MKILMAKYDGGSRIPGARLAPVKLYEKISIYGRKAEKIFLIDIDDTGRKENKVSKIGKLIEKENIQLIIGGDHSITYYCAKSVYKKNSCLIIFDAHLDYFPNNENKIKNWNFIEFLLQNFEKVIVLGERNFDFPRVKNEKITVFSSIDLNFRMKYVKEQLNELISEVDNIYLSIDMDVLSSSEFNSVSYPLIGGVRVDTLLYIINYIFCSNKIYLTDIVEYNPLIGKDNSEFFFQFFKRICYMLEGGRIE